LVARAFEQLWIKPDRDSFFHGAVLLVDLSELLFQFGNSRFEAFADIVIHHSARHESIFHDL
jgi:hypothetical protein